MFIFIALSVVPGHNSSEHISIFIVCKPSQQCVACGSHVADPPRITTHPHVIKDAVPGKPVTFSIQATGTKPLHYQWDRKTGDENDMERIPGATSSTLTISSVQKSNEGSYRCTATIPSVQKSNEGSYYCTVSNCAGSETSQYAILTVGESHCEKTIQFICTLAVLTVQHTRCSFSLHCL